MPTFPRRPCTTRGAAVMSVMPHSAVMPRTAHMSVSTALGCQSMMPAAPIHPMSMVPASMTADAPVPCPPPPWWPPRRRPAAAIVSAPTAVASALMSTSSTVTPTPVAPLRVGNGAW